MMNAASHGTPRAPDGEGSPPTAAATASDPARRRALLGFAGVVSLATVLFGGAWLEMIRAGVADDLHSYTLAIPFVTGWLVWQRRRELAELTLAPSRGLALGLGIVAAGAGGLAFVGDRSGWFENEVSRLSLRILGWVCAVWAAGLWFAGWTALRRFAFASAFLALTVPPPEPMVQAIEIGLQHASADVVEVVFRMLDVTYFRDERSFWLAGLRFEVAQECSGIRSTIVLLVVSILGSYLLLKAPWRRLMIVLLVVPLGIARNTLRICTITLLTANVDPTIIDSPLHHRGGPLFFAVSLIPLFVLLWWFRRQEASPSPTSKR